MTAELKQHTPVTKERLAHYISLRMENENQLERLARMKNNELIPAQHESDGSQHTGGASDRMANAVIRRMEYEELIYPLIEANLREMHEIESGINMLSNPMEREVLRLRYIDGEYCRQLPWVDISMRLYGDDDEKHIKAIHRLHGRALESLKRVTGTK